jgi:hypothetical protein
MKWQWTKSKNTTALLNYKMPLELIKSNKMCCLWPHVKYTTSVPGHDACSISELTTIIQSLNVLLSYYTFHVFLRKTMPSDPLTVTDSLFSSSCFNKSFLFQPHYSYLATKDCMYQEASLNSHDTEWQGQTCCLTSAPHVESGGVINRKASSTPWVDKSCWHRADTFKASSSCN